MEGETVEEWEEPDVEALGVSLVLISLECWVFGLFVTHINYTSKILYY